MRPFHFSRVKVWPVQKMKTEIQNVRPLISSSFENKAIKVFVRHNHHYYFHAPNCFAASCLQLSQLSDLANPLNQDANVLGQRRWQENARRRLVVLVAISERFTSA